MKKIGKSESGISLVEVLVALALVGIIVVGFLMAINTATKAVFIADERATAESIARSQLEYIRQQAYITAEGDDVALYGKISGFQDGYTIWSENRAGEIVNGLDIEEIIAIPWDSKDNAGVPEDVGLQRIKLIIKHYDRVVLIIEGYKVNEGVY